MPTRDESPNIRSRKAFLLVAVSAVLGVLVVAFALSTQRAIAPSQTEAGFTLQTIQQDIEADFAAIRHIGAAELEDLQSKSDVPVLFDVREVEEFAVSRLSGAKQVDPGIANAAFMEHHGDSLRGKTVIFYCSVGVRSSQLAEQLQDALLEAGARQVYNLQGGIFNWHNEARTLTADTGPTSYVHPYNDYWGQLLTRRNLIRYDQS